MNKNVFRSKVVEYMTLRDMSVGTLAKKVGMSQATVYARMKSPERITIEELNLFRKALGFSAEAVTDILCSMISVPLKQKGETK